MSSKHATTTTTAGVNRRNWIKQAATMAGASAALAATGCAPSEPAPVSGGTVAAGTGSVATPDAAVVATTAGRIRGFTRNEVFVFKGVPYGDTTAGENRFLPPRPVQPWTDVRPTVAWGPVSPHGPRAGWVNQEEQFLYQWDDGFAGEDMLRLNVWTPAVSGSRPVLVWIHGGGYASGSSQELRPYDGERFAREHDVVMVSMNHRLNVFGFLDLSQIGGEKYAQSGNASMLDLVQALQWVRDNIANFGGDPGNVTIFGQSGGGGKVTTLMAMPAARGLFHKAVAISGSFVAASARDKATELATLVMQELGLRPSQLDRLHTVSTDALLNAGIAAQQKQTPFRFPAPGTPPVISLGWQPVVDGAVLPEVPFDPAAPAVSASVPFLVGNTFHEFTTGINQPGAHLLTWEQVAEELTPQLGPRTAGSIETYRALFPSAKPFEVRGLIGADVFRRGAVMQTERKAAQGSAPVYHYWFGWKTPVLDGRPLAYHCQDLAFWFDNVDLCLQSTGGGEDARRLASQMSRALVAFARTGDPNHDGIPAWQPFTEANRAMLIFDAVTEARVDPDRQARDVLAEV
ncbi:MAG: carboxylesterase/lipase family protein [Acidobacteria bacterium]|nr:carboxylesterase/lipase family protein [Acidobacteriota bacterium]